MASAHDASYLEDRVLKPLQAAVALVREAAALDATIKQRTQHLDAMEKEVATLLQQKQQILDGMAAAKKLAAEARIEVQGLVQQERTQRDEEAKRWEAMREGIRASQQQEKDALKRLQQERAQLQEEVDRIKQDISGRLELLQKVGR
jgi:chromosome segregation ATPase